MQGVSSIRRALSVPAVEEERVTLTEKDAGRTVELAPGETVAVQLQENPTTGYRWTVEETAGLQLAGDDLASRGGIGAAATHTFRFRAAAPGSFEVRLRNWRAWEGEGSVRDRFTFRVKVT